MGEGNRGSLLDVPIGSKPNAPANPPVPGEARRVVDERAGPYEIHTSRARFQPWSIALSLRKPWSITTGPGLP